MKISPKIIRKVLEMQRDIYLVFGDKILFVIDDPLIITLINNILTEKCGYYCEIAIIPTMETPGQDYPLSESHLENKTVGWLITQASASHSLATKKMLDRKMFVISNPGITPDWPAMLNPKNRSACQNNANAILSAIGGNIGGTICVSHEDGTDLTLNLPNKNWLRETGERNVFTNGTYGELCTAPYFANGCYVLNPISGDFFTNPLNRVRKRTTLVIKDNHVVKITGGKQAEFLKRMLEKTGDKRAFCLGEFAFGLNPGLKPQDKIYRSVIAEKIAGGIHIAIGTNSVCLSENCPEIGKFKYGRYNAGVHIDAIKFGANVVFCPENSNRQILILDKSHLLVP